MFSLSLSLSPLSDGCMRMIKFNFLAREIRVIMTNLVGFRMPLPIDHAGRFNVPDREIRGDRY